MAILLLLKISKLGSFNMSDLNYDVVVVGSGAACSPIFVRQFEVLIVRR